MLGGAHSSSPPTPRVLDLRRFTLGDAAARTAFGREVGEALREDGAFLLVNHGLPRAASERVLSEARRFFGLPEGEKRRSERRELMGQRGYTSLGREQAVGHPVPDLKEFFSVGRELRDATLLGYPPNLWPALPEFKPAVLEMFRALDLCSQALLRALALFVGEPEDRLASLARDGDALLRLIHYPPVDPTAPPGAMRCAAHQDVNLLTLLCDDSAEGVELLRGDGSWMPVRAERGQVLVTSGDMLEHLTNGLVRSATHRITSTTDQTQPRYSLPFFVHPRNDVDLSPFTTCLALTGGSPRWGAIRAGELVRQRLAAIGLG